VADGNPVSHGGVFEIHEKVEFILLSDTLGVTTMKDLVNNRKPPGVTEYTILGPFHRADAPKLPLSANIAGELPGEAAVVKGRVISVDGSPIPNARLDVWQSDAEGFYDVQMPDMQGTVLRGVFHTDSQGKYNFRTIKPSFYPIPDDGPVGQMLAAMGRHPYRPAHIHFIISADGYKPVTSELYVHGDPYLDSDAVFGVRESLVVPFVQSNSDEDSAGPDAPLFTATYEFVLESA
jgi:protocatechuate 3,4-dioxygenase beta subunit